MIVGINESQILTKAISCKRKRRFDGRKCNPDQLSVKTVTYVKKTIFGIFLTVVVKMDNIYQVLWMIQRLC